MIPALLRLPSSSLGPDALDALAALVVARSPGQLVLLGPQRTTTGEKLDEFTLAAALVARDERVRLGVATSVGAGRAPSLVAREATTTQLLGACELLLLEGEPSACRDAAAIIEALFAPGAHTVTTRTASITGAVNDPVPSVDGGPPVLWRDGAALHRLVAGAETRVGDALDVPLPGALPAPAPGTLVVAVHEVVPVEQLASAFGP